MDRTIRTRETLLAAALLLSGAGQAVMAQGDDETAPGAQPLAVLGLSSPDGGLVDITSVHFGNGAPGADVLDLEKLATVPAVPLFIATERGDGAQLELNAFGPITASVAIPLRMHAEVPGTYNLTVASLGTLRGLGCFVLEDVSTGTMIPLWQGDTILVELHANTGLGAGHMLHAHTPMQFSHTDAPCNDGLEGSGTVLGAGPGPFDVFWVNYENVVVVQNFNRTGPVTGWELPAGIWTVIVSGNEVCGTRSHKFVIGAPSMLDATAETSPATCPSSPDGSIRVTPVGGTPPYTYYWSNGAFTEEPELVGVPPGVYAVRVVDLHDCERNLTHLVVHGPAPIPGELVAPATAQPGQSVPFASTAAMDIQRSWDFGDGTTSNSAAPMHAFATAGTYTVTLTLSEASGLGCQTILTATVVVQAATGIDDVAAAEEVRAFTANGNLVLLNPTGEALDVRVFDANGRIVGTPHRTAAHTPRWEIPTNGWPAGVYVLRAQGQWEQWSFSLAVTE